MKTIELPCFKIVVKLGDEDPGHPGLYLGGAIESDLHEDEIPDEYNISIDAIESMILAHACAGIDIESDAYIKGIETAVESVSNNLG